jgi:hypothetical protein
VANILLLGAGFSANWGAPVTSGVFNALIAHPEVRGNRAIHDLLWQNRGNFEKALAALQENFRHDPQRQKAPLLLLQRGIQQTFERINGIYTRQPFELQDGRPIYRNQTVVEFLARFDAIFTLNQDLLLELHYLDHSHNQLTNSRRWNGSCLPGMAPGGEAVGFGGPAFSGRTWSPKQDHAVPNNTQPIYKLHGSTNWKDTGANADIMILGGGKIEAINAIPVLRHYHETFAQQALGGGTRATIIGYGFGDDHINAVLKEGVGDRGLQMYVIDPRGAAIAFEARPLKEGQIGCGPTEFEAWFQRGLYSASQMPLRHLLREESVDIGVLSDFLAGR